MNILAGRAPDLIVSYGSRFVPLIAALFKQHKISLLDKERGWNVWIVWKGGMA